MPPRSTTTGKCVLLCHAPKKAFYRKFLYEPFPVESHLDHFLHDHLCAEVVTRTSRTKQDAVDYLTWTVHVPPPHAEPQLLQPAGRHPPPPLRPPLRARRETLADLEQARCVSIDDDVDVSPLNLGMIASYYYIQYTTVELFASSLQPTTKTKGLLEIIASAAEFDASRCATVRTACCRTWRRTARRRSPSRGTTTRTRR